jgi:heme/copper-type cytochrome/quinol oxidase subunit 2
MPIVVEARSEDKYRQWVATYKAEQQTKLADASTVNQ